MEASTKRTAQEQVLISFEDVLACWRGYYSGRCSTPGYHRYCYFELVVDYRYLGLAMLL